MGKIIRGTCRGQSVNEKYCGHTDKMVSGFSLLGAVVILPKVKKPKMSRSPEAFLSSISMTL